MMRDFSFKRGKVEVVACGSVMYIELFFVLIEKVGYVWAISLFRRFRLGYDGNRIVGCQQKEYGRQINP